MAARSRSADGNRDMVDEILCAAIAPRSKEAIPARERVDEAVPVRRSGSAGDVSVSFCGVAVEVVPRPRTISSARPDRPDVGGVPYRRRRDAIPPDFG